MQCPVCDERMREVEKHGVTVDLCPSCKGVWLDRGELEKLVQSDGDPGPSHGGQRPARSRSLLSDLLGGLGGD